MPSDWHRCLRCSVSSVCTSDCVEVYAARSLTALSASVERFLSSSKDLSIYVAAVQTSWCAGSTVPWAALAHVMPCINVSRRLFMTLPLPWLEFYSLRKQACSCMLVLLCWNWQLWRHNKQASPSPTARCVFFEQHGDFGNADQNSHMISCVWPWDPRLPTRAHAARQRMTGLLQVPGLAITAGLCIGIPRQPFISLLCLMPSYAVEENVHAMILRLTSHVATSLSGYLNFCPNRLHSAGERNWHQDVSIALHEILCQGRTVRFGQPTHA